MTQARLPPTIAPTLWIGVLMLPVWLAGACGGAREEVASYHVRGLVKEVSGEGAEARASIHHEALPTFKDRDGKVVGMEAMEMIFGLAPGVSPAQLTAGDKVAIDFDLHWSKNPPIVITRAQRLPADTVLQLPSSH